MRRQFKQTARLVLLAETAITSSAPSGLARARDAVSLVAGAVPVSTVFTCSQQPTNLWQRVPSPAPSVPTAHSDTRKPGARSVDLDSGSGAAPWRGCPALATPGSAPPAPPPLSTPLLCRTSALPQLLCTPSSGILQRRRDNHLSCGYSSSSSCSSRYSIISSLMLAPTASAGSALASLPSAMACPRLPALPTLQRLQQQQQPSVAGLRLLSSSKAAAEADGGDSRADGRAPAPPPSPPPVAAADTVYNMPNAVSAARLLSGPVIGYWLLQGHYEAATVALAISGASDWLDGYLARRMGASSVFGSYLDPIADKVLIGCVAGALLANGSMPPWLAVVVVGRDVLLMTGAVAFRLRAFGWRWPGREAFFQTADTAPVAAQPPPLPPAGGGSEAAGAGAGKGLGGEVPGEGVGGVAFMRPLLVSKANTVLQLLLLGGYLTRGMYGWPHGDVVTALELATAATTTASLAAYGTLALQGKLFK
ncbi:hypothetical protein PLESTB_000852700 [Pleodorina starrii]|uniref:Uncharacterized protein n=1 Tax=Pleodorina starrii TaxID=330485 RepID=A0A9W6BML8_9CHLO|nr:hypothetical protein PLESTM_001440700 [Pleodorina starrii]GLC54337.1 hypothetical protein PLESTB_000852700 [Pleodorina starrii]GLC71987.1 hypothetical protein PLESTF_001192200 [Pleodorina starrii]